MTRLFNIRHSGDADGKNMKIGEVSKRSGVGIEALRFYEKSGLLPRAVRSESGYRLYGADVIDRLAFIKQAQVLGFSLDEIVQLIKHKQAGENPCREVRETVRERLAELDERIRQMRKYRNELAAALKDWDEKGEEEGHVCGLIEHSHVKHNVNQKNAILGK